MTDTDTDTDTDTTDADLIALLCNGPVTIIERRVIAGRLAALAQENDGLKIRLAALAQERQSKAEDAEARVRELEEERDAIKARTIEICAVLADDASCTKDDDLAHFAADIAAAIRTMGKTD